MRVGAAGVGHIYVWVMGVLGGTMGWFVGTCSEFPWKAGHDTTDQSRSVGGRACASGPGSIGWYAGIFSVGGHDERGQ